MKLFNNKYSYAVQIGLIFLMIMGFTVSCKNDIETINALTTELNLPDLAAFNIEILYTDSGILKGKIIAPEVNQYERTEEPYYEFPKGLKAIFYDLRGNAESYIQGNYAIYYYNKQLWEVRNQVLAENPAKSEKFETEQLFWDQKGKKIYSDKFSKRTNPDGVLVGENGFEADENLSKWRMKGYSGNVNVRDDTPAEEQNH